MFVPGRNHWTLKNLKIDSLEILSKLWNFANKQMLREKAQPKFHPKFMEATVKVRRKKTFTVELNSHGKCAENRANYPNMQIIRAYFYVK